MSVTLLAAMFSFHHMSFILQTSQTTTHILTGTPLYLHISCLVFLIIFGTPTQFTACYFHLHKSYFLSLPDIATFPHTSSLPSYYFLAFHDTVHLTHGQVIKYVCNFSCNNEIIMNFLLLLSISIHLIIFIVSSQLCG